MSQPFLGEMRIFAGNFAPRGWAMCNGQLLSIQQNAALFSILGTTYGGDGRTTFALPNLQACTPIHSGQGPGLSPRTLGDTGGQTSVTLTAATIPFHSHALGAAAAATTGTPDATVALAATSGAKVYRTATNIVTMDASLGSSGSGQAHENRQPYLGILYIIALQGIFPSRN